VWMGESTLLVAADMGLSVSGWTRERGVMDNCAAMTPAAAAGRRTHTNRHRGAAMEAPPRGEFAALT
jgi:hypothetical protein